MSNNNNKKLEEYPKATFRAEDHTYWLDNKQLISVTQLLKKHGLSTDFSMVNANVLNANAERGTLIHAEIEEYIKTGELGFTDELSDSIDFIKQLKILGMTSEELLNNDLVAGTVDLIASKISANSGINATAIIDFKTGATINKEECRWQLSLYAYLFGKEVEELYVLHLLPEGKSKIIPLTKIEQCEIERLIECERNGETFTPKELVVADNLIESVQRAEQAVAEIEINLKAAKADSDSLKEMLMVAMETQGIKSFETTDKSMLITRIEPTTKSTIDGAGLKKDLPEIAAKYSKTSNVKGYIKITLRA